MTSVELERYRSLLNRSAEDARAYVIARLRDEGAGLDVAGMRNLAIEVIQDATGVYGDRAQTTAADLFDEIMEIDGVDATAQLFDDLIDHGRTEGKVRYYARKLVDGDSAGFAADASDLAAYYVHRSAWENLVRNCDLSHVRWARVPTGRETCPYCLMLASRGFVYHTRDTASHGKHRGCDCVIVPGNKDSTIEGYDPDECLSRYNSFTWLNDYLGSGEGKALLKESGLTYGEARDALARARGVYLTGRDSVRSFIDGIIHSKSPSGQPLPVDRLHPQEVAGVARSREGMSFGEADGLRANPGYGDDLRRDLNCQACVLANEVRIRGYDVIARPYSRENTAMERLAKEPYIAFQDGATGALPTVVRIEGEMPTLNRFHRLVEDTVGQGERYILRFTTSAVDDMGHVVCVDRSESGALRLLDPQCGSVYEGRAVREYLKRARYVRRSRGITVPCENNYIFRVDDAEINLRVADMVLEAAR